MYNANPFHPAFGAPPAVLIGRDDVLDDVMVGLQEGPGSEYRVNKITGARGVGKTVLLEAVGRLASEQGWIVVNTTASPSMLDEILDILADRTAHLRDTARRAVTSLGLGPLSIGLADPSTKAIPGWRVQVERLLDVVEALGSGVMFTVDEVSPKHEALQTFGKRFQHFQRESRNVALVVAGLPLNVADFENEPDTTFLRRAVPHELTNLSISAVRAAMSETIINAGREIDSDALRYAAAATEGYPFLVQLVGAQAWRIAQGDRITLADVMLAADKARARIGASVHSSALADLTPSAIRFLTAMSIDATASAVADISRRTGWSPSQTSVYRNRLIKAGMIRRTQHGYVEYALPLMREYILEHVAQD